MKFQMTDGEIVSNFNNASNSPKEQVKVLAELNGVSPQDMAQKMRDIGLNVDLRWYAQTPKTKAEYEDECQELNYQIEQLKTENANLKNDIERKEEVNKALNDMLDHAQATVKVLEERVKGAEKYKRIITILMED